MMQTKAQERAAIYSQRNYFDRWIIRKKNRINKKNKNWLCVIVGQTGGGKSYSGARICELIDPSFMPCIIENGIKSRVAMGNAADLNRILRSGLLKRGSMVLFDEAGVAVGSRDWYSELSKITMYILQTFRHMNIGVVFSVPDMTMVDSQARKLFHSYIEVLYIDYEKMKVAVKPHELQPNPYDGQVYKKYPRFESKKVERFYISKPNPAFIERYEPLKVELSEQLAERMDTVEKRINKKEKAKKTDLELAKEIRKDIEKFKTDGELDYTKIQVRLGAGKDRAARIKKNWDIMEEMMRDDE